VYAAPSSTVGGVILNSRRPGHSWSQITECNGDFVLTPQLCIKKIGHVTKTTPLLRVICYPFGQTWYSLPLYKVQELKLQPFLRYGWGTQNLQETLLWQRDRAMRSSVEILQLQNIPTVWNYLSDPMFSRFYTIPECDRRTDRYTTTTYTALA